MSSAKKIGILSLAVCTALKALLLKRMLALLKRMPVQIAIKLAAASCAPASSQTDLNINNVRARMLNGGDKWWDLTTGHYEVPKIDPPGSAPSVNSLFAGAIWMGGIDAAGQLKVAAMTYRQNGNDFFPGPLDDLANPINCGLFDRHWIVYGSEIANFLANHVIAPNIAHWPAKGKRECYWR